MIDHTDTAEENQSLWLLTVSPAIWGVHFLLSYGTAALWCGMVVGRDGSLGTARAAIAGYTAAALIGIAAVGWHGYRRRTLGGSAAPHAFDTHGDRHRFLGLATVLLSGLSAVATIYAALTIVFLERCV